MSLAEPATTSSPWSSATMSASPGAQSTGGKRGSSEMDGPIAANSSIILCIACVGVAMATDERISWGWIWPLQAKAEHTKKNGVCINILYKYIVSWHMRRTPGKKMSNFIFKNVECICLKCIITHFEPWESPVRRPRKEIRQLAATVKWPNERIFTEPMNTCDHIWTF